MLTTVEAPAKVWQLHIPKTGGTALWDALGNRGHRIGHSTRLREVPPGPVITIVRDPIGRWRSAYAMASRQFKQFPETQGMTASQMAMSPSWRSWLAERFPHVWHRLSWWLESAEYARARCWYIAHTETLDSDWAIIRDRLGLEGDLPTGQHRNDHGRHGSELPDLTPEAIATLREHYAADYELLEDLSRG